MSDDRSAGGRGVGSSLDVEFWPAVVGGLVGLGGVLFLLEPVVAPVAIGPVRARPVALSTVALAAGFCLGAPVFLRRGRRLFGVAHGVFGLAWGGGAVGAATRSGAVGVRAGLFVGPRAGVLPARARRR